MALRDTVFKVRDGIYQMTHRFLHGDHQGYGQPEVNYDPRQAGYGQESGPYASPYENAYQQPPYQQAPQQPPYQQPPYQQAAPQQPPYQQAPQQPPYQTYEQEGQGEYQSPYAGSFYQQGQSQQRQSRAAAHSAEKVVPFPAWPATRRAMPMPMRRRFCSFGTGMNAGPSSSI